MPKLNWISDLSSDELREFLKSVDTILFDIDGVLARASTILPGTVDAVGKFRQLGKKICFVTNNAIAPPEVLKAKLIPFQASLEEIVTPNITLLAYLKKIDFQKTIYIIGSRFTKKMLREAGYSVIEYKDLQTTDVEETLSSAMQVSLRVLDACKNVGIVYADLDINLQNMAVHVAKILLKHMDDVQFLTGTSDDRIPIGENFSLIGPKYFIDGLQRWSGVQAIPLAKPGRVLKEVIDAKFGISQDNRVLMVGDNISTDITFGIESGFQTLLLLTGDTKKQQAVDWAFDEDLKPDYVAHSLQEVYEKVKTIPTAL
ncbi:phosphoglycolate phosphatase 2-like [Dendroctonus ponderosae]|uniref:Uncharacterized protein n=1 Tax=Dendroctonus ponderosae TaxID=77166 RepID=U4TW96_DENPD|nr:phosphoglycolate phosphatase 2 [Dendroctonus ponderosae]XP_048519255.1 phosphoglycolate phosphatase 2-like [Dendroctonus ponderosae]ERL83969.1 hypothetical protein D910_01279 [Dendroctonus ponderosae]ERL84248.1 hypothetical protein D910_01627 [Dendroctonus ponderosae]KAH1000020.1 hypothetical protein HUJ05_007630 [Dendroctonus ponderosae]